MKEEPSEDVLCCFLGCDFKEVYINICVYIYISTHTHIIYVWGGCMCASVHISRFVLTLGYDNSFVFSIAMIV